MKKRVPILLMCVLLLGLGAGVYHLLHLRYKMGDVFAPYSSRRTDPLGTTVLFETLEKLPGLTVARDYSANNRLPQPRGTVYLHVGSEQWNWLWPRETIVREAERFAAGGGRLVILLHPENPFKRLRFIPSDKDDSSPPETKKKSKKESKKKSNKTPQEERWEFSLRDVPLETDENDMPLPDMVRLTASEALPDFVEWHSSTVITNLSEEWRPIYRRGTNVVMAELQRGSGSVVLATDSYLVSNEALSKSPEPELLVWLLAGRTNVVFDEAHLGTVESAGVAKLVRKYNLAWFVGAVLLVATLFVWNRGSRFLPRRSTSAQAHSVPGKSAAEGFVNLLRRNVTPKLLVRTCVDQWKQAFSHARGSDDKAAAAEVLMRHGTGSPELRDPVGLYNELCKILKTRNTNWK